MPSLINQAFMGLTRRAEMNDRAMLVATFVDVGPLFKLLSSKDHQVLYGRRGTGKTHALLYLAETRQKDDHIAIYIDMRTIGSSNGIYADSSIPLSQRATRLLADTLGAIHEGLLNHFTNPKTKRDLSQIAPILDQLATAITDVTVIGTVEHQKTSADNQNNNLTSKTEFAGNKDGVSLTIGDTSEIKNEIKTEQRVTETGQMVYRISFGALGRIFADLSRIMGQQRVWVLLDEWSSTPLELQPYLADLLRRSIFPVPSFTVKIAAIEQRTSFRISVGRNDYIGMELGADIAADINLDDFMVFDYNAVRATQFFQELLFRHVKETEGIDPNEAPGSGNELIQQGFTQKSAFDEFVRATEGVPRDAINIITIAAQRALDSRISVEHIRASARDWYQRDKEAAVTSDPEARSLLHWVIDQVIATRRARAFLLKNGSTPELIDTLFDARVIHLYKRNISARDQPGIRYDAYKLDYGCYVDLMTTSRAPEGLLIGENEEGQTIYMDVPPDDYRAIRRAILNIDEFYNQKQKGVQERIPGM